MTTPRRTFIKAGLGSATTLATGFVSNRTYAEKSSAENKTGCLDYGQSFICNTAAMNSVRFWIESRTTVIDKSNNLSTTFYQCGSCKSEDTFAESDLFIKDNYDFLPILGDNEWLIFRRPATLSEAYRRVQTTDEVWGDPILKLRHASRTKELGTWEEIRDTTFAGIPIVAQTTLENAEIGLAAVIEFPIKTMNISVENKQYQVDTGPIVLPDLSKDYEALIDRLSLAFIAFNAPNFADFVTEQPTPITLDEKQVSQVHHYSGPTSQPAHNRLFAAEPHRIPLS
jgi:hypothetical protein